jgi:predicted nucleic acid-binding protein
MGGGLILETTFLIDLERELAEDIDGPTQAFLREHASEPLYTTATVAGELAAGLPPDGQARWESFLSPFHVLPCNRDVAWEYGRIYSYLRQNGMLIGTNNLWIAATAIAFDMPLVSRNVTEFRRVPGLRLISHAGSSGG